MAYPVSDTYRLITTPSVYTELTENQHCGADAFRQFRDNGKIVVNPLPGKSVSDCPYISDMSFLHKGERDTLHLFYSGSGEFVIIDDGGGAKYCRRNRIPYINALLCPKILFFSGHISEDDCDIRTEMIINIGRYAGEIISYALTCSKEELTFFLP